MSAGELVITAFLAFVSAGLGTLLWSRLGRLEDEMVALREELRGDIAGCASKTDLENLRSEVRSEMAQLRSDIAALRSDLTQVALAVGARPPRASEG